MKRIFTIISAVILGLSSSLAVNRSTEQMLRIAQQKLGTNVMLSMSESSSAKGSAATPQAYVTYNAQNGNGFVIVGADDRLPEIIGYSSHGTLCEADMPPALKMALDNLDRRLPYLNDTYKTSPAKYNPVDTIIRTLWYQTAPYNGKLPTYSDSSGNLDTCATGCVATALAQVINYWGQKNAFPSEGKGSTSWISYGNSAGSLTPDIVNIMSYDYSANPLDFAHMKNYYGETYFTWQSNRKATYVPYTQEEADAVANLMLACGALSKEGYGDESGSYETYLDEIVDHYGFAVGSRLLQNNLYSLSEWKQIIYEQLQKGNPIPYCGFSIDYEAGHAFIVDGLDEDGNVHINWGWSGRSNGYFDILFLFPYDKGVGGKQANYAFNYLNTMIVDFAPTSTKPVSEYSCNRISFDADKQSFVFEGFTTVSHARQAEVAIVAVGSQAEKADTFSVSEESRKILLPKVVQLIPARNPTDTVYVPMDFSKISDGTYTLKVITQDPGQEGWSDVRTIINTNSSVVVTVEDGKAVSDGVQEEVAPQLSCHIQLNDSTVLTRQGREQTFRITVKNRGDKDVVNLMTYLKDKKQGVNQLPTSKRAVNVLAGDSTSYTLTLVPSEEGNMEIFLLGETLLETVYPLSDTVTVSVREPIMKYMHIDCPGKNSNDKFPYTRPLCYNTTCVSATTMDSMYVYFCMYTDKSKKIYSDSLLVNEVKPGDTISWTVNIPRDVITYYGGYMYSLEVGNRYKDDVQYSESLGQPVHSMFILAPGKKHVVKVVTTINHVDEDGNTDMEHADIEEFESKNVYVYDCGNEVYNITLPEIQSEKYGYKMDEQMIENFIMSKPIRDFLTISIDGEIVELDDVEALSFMNEDNGFEFSFTGDAYDESLLPLGKYKFLYTEVDEQTMVSSVESVNENTVSKKVVRNGSIIIMKNGRCYNAVGLLVK